LVGCKLANLANFKILEEIFGLYLDIGFLFLVTVCYQIKEKRFFFGKWLTVIFFSSPFGTPLRGLNIFTCRPTLIFFVRAPWGNTACTWGTTVLLTTPPEMFLKIQILKPEKTKVGN
jgi:uncharacterized membrane protein